MTRFLRLMVIGAAVVVSRGEDWPDFRGPTAQGISSEKNLPKEWSPTKHVAWSVATTGLGWSSPSIAKDKIFLTAAVSTNGGLSLRALCHSTSDGKQLWDTEVFGPNQAKGGSTHSKNSHASPTAVVEGDRVYVHFGHQGTACLDLNGKVIWRKNELRYSPVHGSGGTPLLVGDKLIFSADGANDPFIAALKKETGEVAWKVPRQTTAKAKFSFSTPLLIEVNGKKQVITPGSGAVSALDPADGREIWRARYGEGYSVIPRPVFGHGMIYISSGYDRPVALAVRVDGMGDVTDSHIAWKVNRAAPNTPSMLVVGSEVYMVSDGGIASCLDARTGETHWQERIGGNYSASPLYADGHIYFQSEEGVGTVIKANKTFTKVASNDLKERTLASPAIANGALYIRTAERLYKIAQ